MMQDLFVEIDSQTPSNAYFLLVNITAKNEFDEIYTSHFFLIEKNIRDSSRN